jgi:hypothetical protein
VLRPRRVGGDEGEVDLGRRLRGELHLGALGRLGEPLQRLRVLAQVDALIALELLSDPVDDAPVEVVSAQVAVAARGAHLDHAVAHVQQRDVEGAATEVEHEHGLLARLVQPVGERRGGRLVDDPQHFQPGDLAGVLGRLALGVVEVGGHRDDCLGHALAERLARVLRKLAQDHRGDLFGRVLLAADLEADGVVGALDDLVGHDLRLLVDLAPLAPDEALGGIDRSFRVQDGLALRDLADESLAVFGEGNHRRRHTGALGVGDDLRLAALHGRGYDRVGGSEVDPYRLRHLSAPFFCRRFEGP